MTAPRTYGTVLVDHDGPVATITLNRPDRRNALSSLLIEELSAAMAEAGRDDDIRAIVLTGAGRAFCAGLDLRELGETGDNMRKAGPAAGEHAPWQRIHKPVIGAINGPATTGGLEIVLHCDFLLAAEEAAFGDTHARVGVLPGWGLSYLLPQAVGVRRAREMSLTGRLVPAAEAFSWGLVNHVLPAGELLPAARRLAASAAELTPAVSAEFLSLYRDTTGTTLREAEVIEETRSFAWADAHFHPDLASSRGDAIIARGSAQL